MSKDINSWALSKTIGRIHLTEDLLGKLPVGGQADGSRGWSHDSRACRWQLRHDRCGAVGGAIQRGEDDVRGLRQLRG